MWIGYLQCFYGILNVIYTEGKKKKKKKKNASVELFSSCVCGFMFLVFIKDQRSEYGIRGTEWLTDVLQLKMSTQCSDCRSPSQSALVLCLLTRLECNMSLTLQLMPPPTEQIKITGSPQTGQCCWTWHWKQQTYNERNGTDTLTEVFW